MLTYICGLFNCTSESPKKPARCEAPSAPPTIPRQLSFFTPSPEIEGSYLPKIAQVHFHTGKSFEKLGNLDLAIESYKLCLEIDPFNNQARAGMGRAVRNKIESAINVNLGTIRQAQGDLRGAMEFFVAAKDMNPGNVNAWINLGLLFHQSNDIDGSVMCSKKAITLDPFNETAHYNLACAYHDQDKYKEAMMMYQETLSLNSTHRDALFNLGIVYERLGRIDDAYKCYVNVKKVDPACKNALLAISSLSVDTTKKMNAMTLSKTYLFDLLCCSSAT